VLDYRAVEVPLPLVGSNVLRKGFLCQRVQLDEPFVRGAHCFDAALRGEVEAPAHINDCANDGRGLDVSPGQTRPLNSPDWVVLPEVDSWAKPVIGCFAGQKLRTAQKYLGGVDATSVIGKNEIIQTRGTPVLACRSRQSSHPA